MTKTKKHIRQLCVCMLCALILFGCEDKEEPDAITASRGNIEITVTETGTVKFDDEYTVTPLVAGKILTADFEEGDIVSENDVLYTIDDVELRNQIEQTRISLEKARETQRQAENASNDLTLYAKADGLVTNVYVHNGDSVQPGTPICDIVESNYMKLTVPFSLPDTVNLYEGMDVKVIMTADGSEVSGTVDKIYASPQSFGGGRQGSNIEIKIPNPGALSKGDSAYAQIDGISSLSSAALENYTEQAIVASQSGEIINLAVREGDRISSGAVVMQVKNDSTTNSVNTARLNVKDIETNLSQLEEKLDDYIIKSPIDGVVIEKTAKYSDVVASGSPLAVIADTNGLHVNAEIDEMYINDIWKGQRAVASVQNGDKAEYNGSVRKISDSGIEKNGITYYEVEIGLDNTEGLIEGMNMDITIITGEKENALYLPREYVNGNKVTVINDGKKEERTVRTGIKNSEFTEITDGLGEDELVVKGDDTE